MIASLQKKFILISIVSIFLVFTGIFLLLALFSHAQVERTMDTLADAITSNDGVFPAFDPTDQPEPSLTRPFGEVITEETPFSTRFFTVWLNDSQQIVKVNIDSISSISEEDLAEYVSRARERGKLRGWVEDFRYKMVDTEEGSILVFVNGSMNDAMANRLLLTAFLVLLGSAVLILTLTIVISKPVVRPVAESYEKQKQFITDANHELKTPLTLILSNLDILESEFGKNEWLDDIRSEGERMGLLINQLVALSRMDESSDHMETSSFDLSAAAADTVSEFQPLACEHGRTLTASIQPDVTYRGDEALIRRLLSILMDNAVKYCDAQGTIRVELTAKRHPVLTVENTYGDVGRLELDKLFDRFYRGDPARTFSGSFGAGLSIARSIVRNHHGSISAYQKGQAIGFRVELK